MLGKKLLINIVNDIKDSVRSVVIYGSSAQLWDGSFQGNPNDQSDIDFLVIYKREVNPFPISRQIEKEFKRAGIRIDYCPLIEDEFLELLENRIDLCFWWFVFKKGEILYVERGFLDYINEVFKAFSLGDSLLETYKHRSQKRVDLAVAFLKNLHRLAIDAVWTIYQRNKKLSSWDKLPSYQIIVDTALGEGIITNHVACLCRQIQKLRKAMENNHPVMNLSELSNLNMMVDILVRGVIKNQHLSEIDAKLEFVKMVK